MSKAKRTYRKSDKWYKAHKYVKGVTLKDAGTKTTGNHTWSVNVSQPGDGDAYEVCADRLVVAEKDNTILRAKLSCLKDLLIEVLRGR